MKTDYCIKDLDKELQTSNKSEMIDILQWKNKMTFGRIAAAFDTRNKYPDFHIKHTLFAAPYCSESIVKTLPNGLVLNTDFRKRNNDHDDSLSEVPIHIQPSEVSLTRIEEMLQYSTNEAIRSFAAKLQINLNGSLAKRQMVRIIIAHMRKLAGVTNPVFDKFFPTFLKTTGGIMGGTCQHGILYYAKPLIGGESVSDACDAMITIDAKVSVYDAIGTAVRSMSVRDPNFFGLNKGYPCEISDDLVERYNKQNSRFTAKLATKNDLIKTISWDELMKLDYHVGLCDPLHIKNTNNTIDRTLRDIKQIIGLPPHLNTMPHEQIWARTKGLGPSINKMSYGNHFSRFLRNALMFNRFKNIEMADRLSKYSK